MKIMGDRNLKILKLSLPAAVNYLLGMFQTMVDMIFVGRISAESVAAVGMSMQYIGLLYSTMSLFYVGTNALVSRFTGAGKREDAGSVSFSMAVAAFIFSIPVTYFGMFHSKILFTILGASESVALTGHSYLMIFAMFIPFLFLQGVMLSTFNATGDTKTPLVIGVVGNVLNTILDYGLIFGHFGLPEMGVRGAAVALLIAGLCQFLLYLYFAFAKKRIPFEFKFKMEMVKRGLKVGFPTWIERMVTYPSYLVVASMAARFGTDVLAGYQIGLRVEGFAFMPGIGFMIAGMALVGQNLGAGEPEEAYKDGIGSARIAAIFMGLMGLGMFFFARPVASLFTTHDQTLYHTVMYLKIIGLSQVPLGVAFVLSGCLRGAGATRSTFIINSFSIWVVRVVPAYLALSYFNSVLAVYIVMAVETFIRAGLLFGAFKSGGWKHIKV